MGIVVDKVLGKILLHKHQIPVLSTEPTSAKQGDVYINSTDNTYNAYYAGEWFTLHTLSTTTGDYDFMDGTQFDFMDGVPITFNGGAGMIDSNIDFMDGTNYDFMDGTNFDYMDA